MAKHPVFVASEGLTVFWFYRCLTSKKTSVGERLQVSTDAMEAPVRGLCCRRVLPS